MFCLQIQGEFINFYKKKSLPYPSVVVDSYCSVFRKEFKLQVWCFVLFFTLLLKRFYRYAAIFSHFVFDIFLFTDFAKLLGLRTESQSRTARCLAASRASVNVLLHVTVVGTCTSPR